MESFNLNNPGAGIDRRVEKNFPFQSRRPLMERRENFFIENTRERERESLLFSRRRGKKKRRVNWRMQFWRNSLGVNCSILHNSNNSTNELHYYVDMGFRGIVHYGEGASFCDIYDSVTRIPPDQLSPTWSIVSIEGDTRSRNCRRDCCANSPPICFRETKTKIVAIERYNYTRDRKNYDSFNGI